MADKQHIAIVGGGLAGSFLAMRLCQRGHQVSMFDDRNPHSASRAAAGLYNVITGRFGAKSWMADTLLAEIKSLFAQEAWQALNEFVHPSLIYRPFKTYEEYNKWTLRSVDPDFQHLVEFFENPIHEDLIHNPFGGIKILPCGWVETRGFIEAVQELLESHFSFHLFPYRLNYQEIDLSQKKIRRDGLSIGFDQLVFAEGHRLAQNPFFPKAKVIPNKGEILLIQAKGWQMPFVISKKIYLIHRGKGQYVVGSNYQNRFENPHPSKEGREEIEANLKKAIKGEYEVLDHWAGIRPTTPNRRPIIGSHPEYPFVHVLGGFGTKGILLGPYFSRLLADKIEGQEVSIPAEAQLERFL